MNSKKINLDLHGVPQTLLLPLLGRGLWSQGKNPPLYDAKAIELMNNLNYDFDKLLHSSGIRPTTIWWMARAYHFDQAIKKFLQKYPNGTVVNLGAGLDTTFYRVDNGKLTWIDLDLPEVINLRTQLLPPPDRVHYIAKSLLDYSWMDDVLKFNQPVIFIAGGLFMYFEEDQVRATLIAMAEHFPQSELIFDSIETRGVSSANKMIAKADMNNAILKWGFDQGKDLESWFPKIKLLAQFPYFTHLKSQFNFSMLIRLRMFIYDFNKKGGIIHIKYSVNAPASALFNQ